MNYIFAISGADDEVYAVVCHEIENESWYTPKEEELIIKWMNYNYGTFEEAFGAGMSYGRADGSEL